MPARMVRTSDIGGPGHANDGGQRPQSVLRTASTSPTGRYRLRYGPQRRRGPQLARPSIRQQEFHVRLGQRSHHAFPGSVALPTCTGRARTVRRPHIHLVSVLGGDVTIVPQMIDHYRALGIESFKFIRHAESTNDAVFEQTAQIVKDAELELAHTHVGPWDEDLNSSLIEAIMADARDDWFVIADLDEFQLYDRPMQELIDYLERQSFDL